MGARIEIGSLPPRLTMCLVPDTQTTPGFIEVRRRLAAKAHVCCADALSPKAFAIHATALGATGLIVWIDHVTETRWLGTLALTMIGAMAGSGTLLGQKYPTRPNEPAAFASISTWTMSLSLPPSIQT